MFIQTILRKQYEALDYLCLCVKTVCKEGKVVRYCNLNSPLKGLQNPWLLRSTGWIKRFLSLSFIDEGLAENWMMTEMMTEMMTPWTQQENSAVSTDDARRVQSQMTCWTETSRSFKICSQTDSASSFALRSTFFESGFVAVILTLLSLVLYSCCAASPAAGATASTTVLGKLLNCSPKLKLSYRHHHADKQFIHHSTCFPEHSTRFLEHSTRHVQQVSSTMTTILIVIDDHDTCFPIAFGLLYELSPESLKNFNISSRIKRNFAMTKMHDRMYEQYRENLTLCSKQCTLDERVRFYCRESNGQYCDWLTKHAEAVEGYWWHWIILMELELSSNMLKNQWNWNDSDMSSCVSSAQQVS